MRWLLGRLVTQDDYASLQHEKNNTHELLLKLDTQPSMPLKNLAVNPYRLVLVIFNDNRSYNHCTPMLN